MTEDPGNGARHLVGRGVIAAADAGKRESFENPARGNASWVTLFSSELTATSAMSAGIMQLPADGGMLQPHTHAQAEIYFVVAGCGIVSINGVESTIGVGDAAFIPGDALHSLRNVSADILRVFYVFPTDSFSEVVYRFAVTAHPSNPLT